MQKYNNSSLMTLYIKELLGDFNLPRCHVLTERETPLNGFLYIDNGVFKRGHTSPSGEVRLSPVGIYDGKGVRNGSLNYMFGNPYLNITGRFISDSMTYDYNTHKYLGDYLRFIRDYTKLDLMTMYNCFSNTEATNTDITSTSGEFSFSSSDRSYNLYLIPVRSFNDYSIALTSTQPVEVVACIYDHGVNDVFNGNFSFYDATYEKIPYMQMHRPYLYTKLDRRAGNITDKVYRNDSNLCLILKIPSDVSTSIAVIEGNVLDESARMISDCHGFGQWVPSRQYVFDAVPSEDGNNKMKVSVPRYSNLQLLWMNSGTSFPYADRLAEYLIGNTIDRNDAISQNVRSVQKILMSESFKESHRAVLFPDDSSDTETIGIDSVKAPGKWDESLNDSLYQMVKGSGSIGSLFDIRGDVDKDTERILGL